ncbi:MAG: TIGR04283 family arsenosugar biosynthesis glycosyltransferase [Deltaproteobacteria bacterium]|nr:TIGR04283 family arsenosugar biosynthesis glycosyltransferase [Deltaproteobacteria bacterium]
MNVYGGKKPFLSIIIPVLNEAENIQATLDSILETDGAEIIVVDGGSKDKTVEIASRAGVKVVFACPVRAGQLNKGAAEAQGEILLFLHGDTRLPAGFEVSVREIMTRHDISAGAFRLAIDSPKKRYQWIARAANLRSRFLQRPYGDQALFLKAALFRELGGFPDIPIMEDFCLVKTLMQKGRIYILDKKVITSARRWQRLGVFRTTIINQLVVCGFLLGVPVDLLAKFYGVVQKS